MRNKLRGSGLSVLMALIVLPVLGAVAGRLAAPGLARFNYVVRLAEYVRQNELHPAAETADAGVASNAPTTNPQKALKAFKTTGMTPVTLYAQAGLVRRQFETGSTWFGLWCGLAAAGSIASLLRERRRREYETDPADCLACARCYLACPVERERLEKVLGERPL